MPKMKTRKSVAKRLKQTSTGRYMRKSAGVRHLNKHKTAARKRRLGRDTTLDKTSRKVARIALPYGL